MKARVLFCLATVLISSSCSTVKEADGAKAQPLVPSVKTIPAAKLVSAAPKVKAPVAPKSDLTVAPSIEVPAPPKVEVPAKPVIPQMPGSRISRVSVPDKVVALTFDDGPHGSLTPRVLDILDRYNSKGTFFVLGSNARRNPALLQRMVSGGHEVGNHTWNHMNMSRNSRAAIESDLSKTNQAIVDACGVSPRVMRPPYGAGNSSLSSWVKGRFNATTVLWDVDTNDWRKPGVQTVINRAVNGARSGSIILVHDIHKSTVDAVEGIVSGLKARGFRLVTVSELMSRGRNYAGRSQPVVPLDPALTSPPVAPEATVNAETSDMLPSEKSDDQTVSSL